MRALLCFPMGENQAIDHLLSLRSLQSIQDSSDRAITVLQEQGKEVRKSVSRREASAKSILDVESALRDKRESLYSVANVKNVRLDLLSTVLHRIQMQVQASELLNVDDAAILDGLFRTHIAVYKQNQERKAAAAAEEEEFFKFKAVEHKTESEEEQMESYLRKMYPDFSSSFEEAMDEPKTAEDIERDIRERNAMAEEMQQQEQTGNFLGAEGEDSFTLSDEQIEDVYEVFANVYRRRTKNRAEGSTTGSFLDRGQKKKKMKKKDRVRAILEEAERDEQHLEHMSNTLNQAYKSAYAVQTSWLLDPQEKANAPRALNSESMLSHLYVLASTQEALTSSGSKARRQLRKARRARRGWYDDTGNDYIVDVWKGENVLELSLLETPLSRYLERLGVLLTEYPEHPILLQLAKLAHVLGDLPSNSPIMKVLTGLEFLLKKSEDWENYAARHVSLKKELGPLSTLVARWRKLELYSWPQALKDVEARFHAKALRSWFQLYGLLNCSVDEFLSMYRLEEDPPKEHMPKDRFDELYDKYVSDVYKGVDEFLQQSNLGELRTRMDMLRSFQYQILSELSVRFGASADERIPAWVRRRLLAVLRNVVRYYEQFLPAVDSFVNAGKGPIEKKLKDQVKLAKWDLSNYWSLKESSDRSHRKVAKFAREYEVILFSPLRGVLYKEDQKDTTETDTHIEFGAAGTEVSRYLAQAGEDAGSSSTGHLLVSSLPAGPKYLTTMTDLILSSSSSSLNSDELSPLLSRSKKMRKLLLRSVLSTAFEQARYESCVGVEQLSMAIVKRCTDLRTSNAKMAHKKKALVDLLKILKQVGLSFNSQQVRALEARAAHHMRERGAVEPFSVGGAASVDVSAVAIREVDPLDLTELARVFQLPSVGLLANLQQSLSRDLGPLFKSDAAWKLRSLSPSDDVVSLTDNTDHYMTRILSGLRKLRSRVSAYHSELSRSEIARSKGFCEYMFSLLCCQRIECSALVEDQTSLLFQLHSLALIRQDIAARSASDGTSAAGGENGMDVESDDESRTASFTTTADASTCWRLKGVIDSAWTSLHHYQLLYEKVSCAADDSSIRVRMQAAKTSVAELREELSSVKNDMDYVMSCLFPVVSDTSQLPTTNLVVTHRGGSTSSSANGDGDEESENHSSNRGTPSVASIVLRLSHVLSKDRLMALPLVTEASSRPLMQIAETAAELKSQLLGGGEPSGSNRHNDNVEDEEEEDVEELAARFEEDIELLSKALLLPVQKTFKQATKDSSSDKKGKRTSEAGSDAMDVEDDVSDNDDDNEEETSDENVVPTEFKSLDIGQEGLLMHRVATSGSLSSVNGLLCRLLESLHKIRLAGDDETYVRLAHKAIALLPLVVQLQHMVSSVYESYLRSHKSSAKLLYVLLCLFTALYSRGFCRQPEEEDGDDEEGDVEDDVQGTGMGEGEGKEDVSNELQDESQIEGLQGEEKAEPTPQEEKPDTDKGMEMEQDFDGEMVDVDDKDDGNESDEQEDQEELEKEMADMGDAEPDVVDEKLWESSDDDDEDEQTRPEDEKYEENAGVHGGQEDDETIGRDQDEDDKKAPPKDDEKRDDGDGGSDSEDDLMDELGDESGDDEEERGEEDAPDPINEDREDRKEESTGKDAEDFPQEMNLDEVEEDEKDEPQLDNEGSDGDAEGEDEDLPQDALDEKLDYSELETKDQDMQEDGEGEDQKEDEPEKSGEAVPDEENKEEEKEDDEGAEEDGDKPDQKKHEHPEANPEEEEDEEEEKERDEQHDESQKEETLGGVQVEGGQQGQDKAKEEEEKEQDATPTPQNDLPPEEKPDDDDNEPSASNMKQSETGEATQNDPETSGQPESSSQKDHKDASQQEKSNPYSSLGDTLKKWKERLNVLDRKDEPPAADDQKQEDDAAPEDGDEADGQNVEHVGENEDADMQMLAAAEENVEQDLKPVLERDHEEDKEDGEAADDDAMKDKDQGDDEEEAKKDKQSQRRGGRMQMGRLDMMDVEDEDEDDDEADGEGEEEEKVPSWMTNLDEEEPAANATSLIRGEENENDPLSLEDIEEDIDLEELRNRLDTQFSEWCTQGHDDLNQAHSIWQNFEALTSDLSQTLCEQLRHILEPMVATKLKGDFRTGKRINVKKIIPYIASQFRKDKIWLRRRQPNKREYQVMVAIDDSESMIANGAGRLAIEALTVLCRAMTQLEVGELAVASFGEELNLLHKFDQRFTDDSGAFVVSQFKFQQKMTKWSTSLKNIVSALENSRQSGGSGVDTLQLVFVISDARVQQDRESVARWTREALSRGQLLVLIVVDSAESSKSILNLKSVTYPNGKMRISEYLDDFPFPYYVVLQHIEQMPEVIADALRQWFEMIRRCE